MNLLPSERAAAAALDVGGAVVPKFDCPHVRTNYAKCIVDAKLDEATENSGLTHPCRVCHSQKENWMCLSCGDIFCSRYVEGHCEDHWMSHLEVSGSESKATHSLCLSFTDLNVWCYVCGAYIKDPTIIDTLYKAESVKFGRSCGSENNCGDRDSHGGGDRKSSSNHIIDDCDANDSTSHEKA